MRCTRNVGERHRALYVAGGAVLALGSLALGLGGPWRVVLPALGAIAILEGIVGF